MGGVWFGGTLLINEWSTPCVNIFWHLTYTNQTASRLFMANGIALLVLFTVCRMLFIPYSFYQFSSQGFCFSSANPNYSWAAPLMMAAYAILMGMNTVWYVKLVAGAAKKLRSGQRVCPESELCHT